MQGRLLQCARSVNERCSDLVRSGTVEIAVLQVVAGAAVISQSSASVRSETPFLQNPSVVRYTSEELGRVAVVLWQMMGERIPTVSRPVQSHGGCESLL